MFKNGDAVKLVATDYLSPELANGETAVVHEVQVINGSDVVLVAMDNGFTPNDIVKNSGEHWAFFPNQLEHVE